jgi:plasmid maintenance system antidote protein VapI
MVWHILPIGNICRIVVTMKKRTHAEELQDLLDSAGLSQRGAARELQIAERTMRYYVSGESDVPRSVMLALEKLTDRDNFFYQKMAARVRNKAGCTCGEFEIATYPGVSRGPRVLAGFSPGTCKTCADGTTTETAYRLLKLDGIPVIQNQRRRQK